MSEGANFVADALKVRAIYDGSDGDATRKLYAKLLALGPGGMLACNLMRAQKCSSRAKVYKGRRFKNAAYDTKNWALQNLCNILEAHSARLGINWGWKEDGAQAYHGWVLYVVLPGGQVSFHGAEALCDRRFSGDWDGSHESANRILLYVASILTPPVQMETPSLGTDALVDRPDFRVDVPADSRPTPMSPRREVRLGLQMQLDLA